MKLHGCLCAAMRNDCYMKKGIFRKLIVFIICLLCISGCGADDNTTAVLLDNPNLSESIYSLGDNMGDYKLTDVNGNTYTFSELLATKKAIVLNFWFINCGPCQMEFPYLQAAADKYSNDIAVLAINPTDDRENQIKNYAINNDLSLPFIKGEQEWISAFSLQGFPTTIVIDRYGKIAFSHVGAVTEEGIFEDMFKHFVSDDYKHSIVKNINEF